MGSIVEFDLSLPNLQDVMEDDALSNSFLMSPPPAGSVNYPTCPDQSSSLYDHPISARSPYEPSTYLKSSIRPLERHSSVDYSLLSSQSHDSTRWNSPYPGFFKSGPVSPYLLSPYPQSEMTEPMKSLPIPSIEPTMQPSLKYLSSIPLT